MRLALATALILLPQTAPEPYALSWATFLGGSAFERAQGCAVDAAGNVFIVGNTFSANLPATAGAYQRTYRGDTSNSNSGDGYVAKISADGRSLLWCTYLGGTGGDRSYGVQVDAAGFVYVTTWTTSADFPVTPGAYDTTHNGGMDVAYTKLRADGSGVVWSTFVGGSGAEQARGSIFLDAAGNVWSSGWTDSADFPTTAGAFQRTLRGAGDAFVFQLSADGSRLLASTLLGGSHATLADNAYTRVTVHTDGTAYVSGVTRSRDFPVTAGAYQTAYAGDGTRNWMGDAFVVRFNASLSGLVYATLLGGSASDEASVNNSLTVDASGRAILCGMTESTDFPTTPGALQRTYGGGAFDAFVAILSADGRSLVASTYVGGSGPEESSGMAVDPAGNVWFSGNTQSTDYPVTANALQTAFRGGAGNTDAWLSKLSPTLSTLLYSTYLGGSGTTGGFGDRGRCLVLDASGAVVVTGDANSANFPVTAGAYDATHNGNCDAFVAKFARALASPGSLQFSSTAYTAAENDGTATITVTRTGGSAGALSGTWSTSNGTATAGADYAAGTGTLTWADGDTSPKTFTVAILDDAAVEGPETVFLSLGASSATLTIQDDDSPPAGSPGTLRFSASTYAAPESAVATITVTRAGGTLGALTATYATADGTALSGPDYAAASGTLTWADGDGSAKTFTVALVNDAVVEAAETVLLSLSSSALGSPSAATLTIQDDDAQGGGAVPGSRDNANGDGGLNDRCSGTTASGIPPAVLLPLLGLLALGRRRRGC